MVAGDPAEGAKDAILQVTSSLDVEAGELSASSAIHHVASMAEVIALALRSRLGRAERLDPVPLGEHEWHSNLFRARGANHRIALVAYLDDNTLRSLAHSWRTIGELAALEEPLTLTAVVIGASRGGRRHSPWAKAFVHPVQKVIRFGRRKGSKADGFTEGWKEAWREQTNIPADTWLERMQVDDMLRDLIESRKVQFNAGDERMKMARREMLNLTDDLVRARTDAPMRRSSCDEIGHGSCPWQPYCYSPNFVRVEDLGHLYRRRPESPIP